MRVEDKEEKYLGSIPGLNVTEELLSGASRELKANAN